ncbi:MAG TPA: response regulator [Gemmatimonadaceae bacterium]|nr:response regulator [Gemmatimonadaceae bacterium]
MDDDPIVLAILSSLLDELGIDSVQAHDGRSGLRQLTDDLLSLDLLVTDLHMPDLTGDALVLAVRELGGERDLPIVVASSFLDADKAEALRVAGANAVVDKSGGLGPVAAAARSLLAARGQLDSAPGELELALQGVAEAAIRGGVETGPRPTPVPLFRIPLARARH